MIGHNYYNYNYNTFCDVGQRILKNCFFSGLNCSGGFPDLFLAVLTGIYPFLRFLYDLSKSIKFPKKNINLC